MWKEGVAVNLDTSWDNLVFVWLVISCANRERWAKVAIIVDGSLLIMDAVCTFQIIETFKRIVFSFLSLLNQY